MVKRIIIGIAISVPVLIFLIIMLSSADIIFSRIVTNSILRMLALVNLATFTRILFGVFVGMYLFGILYSTLAFDKEDDTRSEGTQPIGDCVILNIVLTSVLLVYALFVAIQFRYLFATPDRLPYGLTFVTYARRGFFELVILSGINIIFILIAVWLTKSQNGRGARVTQILCLYLCAVTVVLLVSSFYRMWLYGSDDGLTRMRLLVFGFLIFKGVGLIFTFFYIVKPKFNIILVYCLVALSYYLLLNLVPIDRIIARDQVNRYFAGRRDCVHYALTLSPDAAPEIARLLDSRSAHSRMLARAYLNAIESDTNWHQWNLSRSRARRL